MEVEPHADSPVRPPELPLPTIHQIEVVLDAEREGARTALAAGNKQRALTALRRRKYQESLLKQTDQQLATLQELVSGGGRVTRSPLQI